MKKYAYHVHCQFIKADKLPIEIDYSCMRQGMMIAKHASILNTSRAGKNL